MRVIRARPEDRVASADAVYSGVVRRQTIVSSGTFRVLEVTFEQGAHTKLHAHTTDQVLVITAGRGIVGTREQRFEVRPGDVVHTPAGEPHFHGAAEDVDMTHFAILGADSTTTILGD